MTYNEAVYCVAKVLKNVESLTFPSKVDEEFVRQMHEELLAALEAKLESESKTTFGLLESPERRQK